MHFNLFLTIFVFTYLSKESKADKWINPTDMSPKYSKEWVDPHDMRPSKEYLKYTNNPSSLHKQQIKQINPAATASEQLIEMYYRRTINMLLKSVHEDNNEIDTYSGYLYFKINSNDYERLRNYAENTEMEKDLYEVNRILEGILTKPSHQHIQEFLETWFHKFLTVTFSRSGIISIIALSYFVAVYQMIRAKYHLRNIMTFFVVNIFVYDFIFTWVHLYQKTEVEHMANRMKYDEVPVECNPQNMNSWQFLWNLFRVEDNCQKFHQVTYVDFFWKVSPGAVLTDMFARTIEQPASSVGNAFANVCAAIYNKFPWPMNIIIFPVALIFFCLMTMITLSVIFNRNLHFNFLHLFSFSNSVAGRADTNGDRLTDQNVERLLRITEQQQLLQQQQQLQQSKSRVFVEEVTPVLEHNTPRQAIENKRGENSVKGDENPVKQDKNPVKQDENPIKEGYENTVMKEEITSTTEENTETSTNVRQRLNTNNIGAGDS